MHAETETVSPPAIMAPAGNEAAFLAALAAGADAIYCGLKQFSARMEAKNFTPDQLSALTRLAHDRGVRVYVAFNSLLKPGELKDAGRLIEELERRVKPDALIVQDLALIGLAEQVGFSGGLHLSTLTNVSFPRALQLVREGLGIERIVIPRELTIDEVKALADACPPGLGLEVFVHGALCFGVSGRCYWSSYLGGKSGLRGRCVQPCRRLYSQQGPPERHFSCLDLGLDTLTKVLLSVPEIRAWKIEGRKKGPRYVYNTVTAYRLLRDGGADPGKWAAAKKQAQELLSEALGRPTTHYHFLPQRPQNPVGTQNQTGSGFLMGRVRGVQQRSFIRPREDLLAGDVLRVGYEDEPWHAVHRITSFVPKKTRKFLEVAAGKAAPKGVPVFLTDRREQALDREIEELRRELGPGTQTAGPPASDTKAKIGLPKRSRKRALATELSVFRRTRRGSSRDQVGLWLSHDASKGVTRAMGDRIWWWLPPNVWPDGEKRLEGLIRTALKKNARRFVLNAPWQATLFPNPKGLSLWAGPFCNAANGLAISVLASMGFAGVIVSPELGEKDYLELPGQSPLPLGIVIAGLWPFCTSRVLSEDLHMARSFTSPKGEQAWVAKHGGDFWVYPTWKLDLRSKEGLLRSSGYSLFVNLAEPVPRGVRLKKRPGMWNWDVGLL